MLPSTLEWQLVAALAVALGLAWLPGLVGVAVAMLVLSILVAVVQAAQARLPATHDRPRSRALVAALCYAQPLVRSWARYQTRLFSYHKPVDGHDAPAAFASRLSLAMPLTVSYWDEQWHERYELLDLAVAVLSEHQWGKVIDSGWSDWDLEVSGDPWTLIRVSSVQEDHGGGKRVIRLRYRLRPDGLVVALLAFAVAIAPIALLAGAWSAAVADAAILLLGLGIWWLGARRAMKVVAIFDRTATTMGLLRIVSSPEGRAVRNPGDA
jgi:hypothetical protein